MSNIVLTSAIEQNVIDAEAQISANCGFPNGRGTDCWDITRYSDEHEIYYITKPPITGWRDGVDSFTQAQMMAGVIDVEEQEWE